MKFRFISLIIALLALREMAVAAPESSLRQESLQQWQSNRFGMFIHWGPVSLTGQEISWSPVTATEFRLNILDATEGRTINDIELQPR